jgi:hypothetical protein
MYIYKYNKITYIGILKFIHNPHNSIYTNTK